MLWLSGLPPPPEDSLKVPRDGGLLAAAGRLAALWFWDADRTSFCCTSFASFWPSAIKLPTTTCKNIHHYVIAGLSGTSDVLSSEDSSRWWQRHFLLLVEGIHAHWKLMHIRASIPMWKNFTLLNHLSELEDLRLIGWCKTMLVQLTNHAKDELFAIDSGEFKDINCNVFERQCEMQIILYTWSRHEINP